MTTLPSSLPNQLTTGQFAALATVPAENEWFANQYNSGTRRVYQPAIRNFMRFVEIIRPFPRCTRRSARRR